MNKQEFKECTIDEKLNEIYRIVGIMSPSGMLRDNPTGTVLSSPSISFSVGKLGLICHITQSILVGNLQGIGVYENNLTENQKVTNG